MKELIGLNIKHLRKSKKMNQGELGELLDGKSAQIVSRYEKGETETPLDVIYKVAEVFQVSVGDLLTIDLSKGYDQVEKPEKDLTEVMPLIQALKESQEKYKKLEAEVLKDKELAKKLGLE